ncbi:MAG: M28 family peptidase [Candidatus Tectomicrobia bacterium]|uniref:Carboxypeptidase Q n=1 Tax=Tectimicrobiota bacterium TaxID=2528274 RepID=A0A932MMI3_UNCTE|nr:M28 family peptidase [Candidatus Tectomicrobia bacterium]
MASISADVNADLLWKHMEALCQWERYTGTAGENAAVDYIAREMDALGIPVTVHEFDAYISIPGPASLDILGKDEERIPAITAVFAASTGEAGVTGDAAYVGEAEGPGEGSVAGRIVVAERMMSPARFFAFERAGAIAQVYVNLGYAHEGPISTIWGSPTPETAGRLPCTPLVTLSREQGQDLIDRLKTRRHVRLRVRSKADTRWRRTRMPVADISPSKKSEEFALLGGHLDSWQIGANDNAAGDTTLMELARLIHARRRELRRGLRVIWFNGHSHGRFSGSTWYADHKFEELRARCVGYLNIDQPGARQATLYRPFSTADISAWVQDVVKRLGGQKTVPTHPLRMADQSFWGVGVPSFSFLPVLPEGAPDLQKDHPHAGFPEYWHNPADTLDKMDKKLLAEHCRLYAGALHELCSMEVAPLDPRTVAGVAEAELAALRKKAAGAFDLAEAEEAAREFRGAAQGLMKRIGKLKAPEANRALLKISHTLNPVLYTQAGPYDQDPASPAVRFPGLHRLNGYLAAGAASHEGRLLYTRLVRERNRAAAALRQAAEIAEGR